MSLINLNISSTGGFSTAFADVAVDRCMGVVAIARGATGDTASAKVMPMAARLRCASPRG